MLVVQLPQLPKAAALESNTFESVMLCFFISSTRHPRGLGLSQRQILESFNRSNQRVMSKYLKHAQEKGFIKKTRLTTGVNPDGYVRGEYFSVDSQESRGLITLSNSLWGPSGLLRSWPYRSAWGYGCFPDAAVLCLATLRLLDEEISRKSLREYLSPLVPQSSFNAAIKVMYDNYLIYGDNDRLVIAPDWEIKMEKWLEDNPACNERQATGNKRRADEAEKNLIRVRSGKLTDAETKQLLALPCVVKGCKSKRHQIEHFPPKHFLKQLDVITNRYFVWSICRRHNRATADFIKLLDSTTAIPRGNLGIKTRADPLRIYTASANRNLQKFYEAHSSNDQAAATAAIWFTLGLWKAINALPVDDGRAIHNSIFDKREVAGRNAFSPERSQLSYRPR
jgi:hypothetical protein